MQNTTSATAQGASPQPACDAAQPLALTPNKSALPSALSAQFALNLLHAMLNQVDYGLAAVNAKTRALVLANAPGYAALQAGTQPSIGLVLNNGIVCTCLAAHTAQFEQALARTATHHRDLLRLTAGKDACTVAVLPLLTGLPFGISAPTAPSNNGVGDAGADQFSLLVFSKQTLCDATSVALFARERGLTPHRCAMPELIRIKSADKPQGTSVPKTKSTGTDLLTTFGADERFSPLLRELALQCDVRPYRKGSILIQEADVATRCSSCCKGNNCEKPTD